MTQFVFIHGPGAGGCAEGFRYQLDAFPGSIAPNLPGHLGGTSCSSVARYSEWLRGWLWAQGHHTDLLLVGFTLGASIALQYALDYPGEVKGLVLMTVAMRPKIRTPGTLELRLQAAEDPVVHARWLDAMRAAMHFVAPDMRERLMACHQRVGPLSQYRDLVVIDQFDVRERMNTLQAPLLLIRGVDDAIALEDYEQEIHQAVPGSQYLPLREAGHFPMAERPEAVNQAMRDFVAKL